MAHLLIVSARFYEDIAAGLEQAAAKVLTAEGATFDMIQVPGTLEIGAAIRYALEDGKHDGYVALGCVIRGETTHYDIVCAESARALTWLTIEHKAAIGNGIITVENEAQAHARQGKGGEAAYAALSLVHLKEQFGLPMR